MVHMTATPQIGDRAERSAAELVGDLTDGLTTLVHQEIELAKAELSEKGKRAGIGAGMFGSGALLAVFGLGSLTAAAIAALQLAMPVWLAALVVGVVYLLGAGGLALAGKHEVAQAVPPVPEQAVESTKEDVAWLKMQARSATR
jgi:uncharacterized membrane protein YqjE